MIELWQNWISAFDLAVDSDDWSPLRPLLDDDVTYTVSGAPFACHLVGAEAVIAGFRKSISNFDRQFDQRWWFGVGVREFAPDVVSARAMGVYRLADKPLLHFSAHSDWRFREGKVIACRIATTCANMTCRLRSGGWRNMRHMPTRVIAEPKQASRQPEWNRFENLVFWLRNGWSRLTTFGIAQRPCS